MNKAIAECHVCGGTQLIYALPLLGIGVSHCPTCGQSSIGRMVRRPKRDLQQNERGTTILRPKGDETK